MASVAAAAVTSSDVIYIDDDNDSDDDHDNDRNVNVFNYKTDKNEEVNDMIDLIDDDVEVVDMRSDDNEKISEVLDFFPDADIEYVRNVLKGYNNNLTTVLSLMADENTIHPKAKDNQVLQSSSASLLNHNNSFILRPSTTTSSKNTSTTISFLYDYMSKESFVPSSLYIYEAIKQLCNDFLFISCQGARKLMKVYHHHYAICHDKIMEAVKVLEEDDSRIQYYRIQLASDGLLSNERLKLLENAIFYNEHMIVSCTTKIRRKKCRYVLKRRKHRSDISLSMNTITDPTLIDEIMYVQNKTKNYLLQ